MRRGLNEYCFPRKVGMPRNPPREKVHLDFWLKKEYTIYTACGVTA